MVLQPMGERIIRSLELKYHRHLVCKFCRESQPPTNTTKVSMFDTVSMLAASWNSVSQETITNCYWQAEFCETSECYNEDDDSAVKVLAH
jgi:hypothetical protein